ncbi:MAG: hypothetical protein VX828_00700 [Candidatus Thermoplasmatota archaeon]|nr:hypothetical protein [Candidatus Thermoplasmatota archaeon]
MDGEGDEGRAPSKPEMVVLSERSGGGIQPEVVVDHSIRNAAKEGESRKDVRVYWILFHICCWILLVVSLKMDWPEWCMGVLIFAILIWFPVKSQGASLSVELLR